MKIFLFQNIRNVIAAESMLNANKIAVTIRPVPNSLSSECGMCIEVEASDEINAMILLTKAEITFKIQELQ